MQGEPNLSAYAAARQWAMSSMSVIEAAYRCERVLRFLRVREGGAPSGEVGEFGGVLGDPVLGALLDGDGVARFLFQLLSIVLDMAHLFDHACAKQGVFVDEGDAYQVAVLQAPAPGHDAGVARQLAQQGNAQLDRCPATKATRRVACHPAQADIVQPLPGYAGLLAQHQFHRHVAWMTQKLTHEHRPRMQAN
ncbi:protein of unknown function [Ectopseudomonas oleovorans]|nr:protein of unknown function [Pseudomonas oleovorans]